MSAKNAPSMTREEVIKQLNIQIAQREKSGINSTQAVEDVCIETAWELDRLRAELAEAKGELARRDAIPVATPHDYQAAIIKLQSQLATLREERLREMEALLRFYDGGDRRIQDYGDYTACVGLFLESRKEGK